MVPHAGDRLVLRETDEADNPTGAYVFSEQNAPSKQGGSAGPRVDVMVSCISFSASAFDVMSA